MTGVWKRGLAPAALLACAAGCGTAQAQEVDIEPAPAPAPDAAAQSTPTTPKTTDPQHRPRTPVKRASDTSPSALAGDTQSSPPPGLFGDWQKIRTTLGAAGIGVTARYASESGYNFAGGDRKLFRETGQFDFGVLLDMEKVAGLKGGAVQATVTWRRGYDLTTDAGLGALQQVQEVYGRGQTVRVTQLWYEQKFADRAELKFGLTNPGEDFAVFSCHFMNLSFCGAQPGNLVGDYWYNWPVSQWGARLRVELHGDNYLAGGVYAVNPRNLDNSFFVAHFKGNTGVLVPVEFGHQVGGDGGHVGSYKVGGWVTTAHGDDVLLDVNHQPIVLTGLTPLQHKSRYGVYASIQQQLTGKSKDGKALDGLGVFANLTQADRKTSVTDNQVSLGLFYKGLVTRVPGDVLGFAVARTNVNHRATEADLLVPGTPVRHAEYAAEVYYSIQPVEWLELRPNVQWIHHPGGIREANDVGVLGMKAALTL